MVLIHRVNVKLLVSSNGYVPDCCLMMAIVVVLCTGSRNDHIHQKDERVIYEFGIQLFQRCHYGLCSKVNFSQATLCCPKQDSSSTVNFKK
jgi:hypothetical protein